MSYLAGSPHGADGDQNVNDASTGRKVIIKRFVVPLFQRWWIFIVLIVVIMDDVVVLDST